MISVQVLVDKINSFECDQEVADFLISQHIKGDRTSASRCVISNWIAREAEEPYVTTSDKIKVWFWEGMSRTIRESYELNEALSKFVYNFDSGHYPELDSGEPSRIGTTYSNSTTLKKGRK